MRSQLDVKAASLSSLLAHNGLVSFLLDTHRIYATPYQAKLYTKYTYCHIAATYWYLIKHTRLTWIDISQLRMDLSLHNGIRSGHYTFWLVNVCDCACGYLDQICIHICLTHSVGDSKSPDVLGVESLCDVENLLKVCTSCTHSVLRLGQQVFFHNWIWILEHNITTQMSISLRLLHFH